MSRAFNKQINTLSQEMVQIYRNDNAYISYTSAALPQRSAMIEILGEIRKLFYPRHYGNRQLFNCTIRYYIGNLMMSIEERLHHQVRLALLRANDTRPQGEKEDPAVLDERASAISCEFMNRLPKVRQMLTMDVQAAYDGDPAASDLDEIVLTYPGIFTMMVYRLAHELYTMHVPILPRMMSEYAHSRTGIDINPGAVIGKYFFMDHGTGIVIGETTEIGDYVKLYQGVTLGALSTRGGQRLKGKKRHPTIGDRVTIYSNASVLGGETVIGHDTIIGGNCFITEPIPACSRVFIKNPDLTIEKGLDHRVGTEIPNPDAEPELIEH